MCPKASSRSSRKVRRQSPLKARLVSAPCSCSGPPSRIRMNCTSARTRSIRPRTRWQQVNATFVNSRSAWTRPVISERAPVRGPCSADKAHLNTPMEKIVNYSIIGSGAIGRALATHFASQGIEVLLANSRGPTSLTDIVRDLGPPVQAATVREAAGADIVILAVPFSAVPNAVGAIADWSGRIVVDATNAVDLPSFRPTDLGGRLSSDIVAQAVPGARVVKAFNTLPAAVLASNPVQDGGRRVVFVSSDDVDAAATVAALCERLGFYPINLGRISQGGRPQHFGSALPGQNLVKIA